MKIPFSWGFCVMEAVGDNSENPFENSVNNISMAAICLNTEINLREIMGEKDIPLRIRPVAYSLM